MIELVLIGFAVAAPMAVLHAETRGKPWTDDQLLHNSREVFIGEVGQPVERYMPAVRCSSLEHLPPTDR